MDLDSTENQNENPAEVTADSAAEVTADSGADSAPKAPKAPKAKRAPKKKKASGIAEGIAVDKPQKLTRFKSHGLGYYRVTVPREYGERFCSDLNLFDVTIDAETGAVTFTPIRPLIRNENPHYAE